jgi:hypothetical protein
LVTNSTLGCTDTSNVKVITAYSLPAVNAGLDQSICTGASITLSGSGANSYSWSNGISNASSFVPTISQLYTLTGIDVNGCSNTDQVQVTVNALPTVDAGINQTVCAGSSVVLIGSGASTYSWNNGVVNSVPYFPTISQTYTVTGIDANGCSNSDQVQVTVNALPNIYAGNDQTICAGSIITLTAFGGNTYNWNNGVTNAVPFSANTSQTYTVTGIGLNGCSNTDQVNINVLPLPIVDAGIDQSICAGSMIVLSGTGANSYSWNNGVSNGIGFIPSNSQTFTVTGMSSNGCSNTDQINVNVLSLPIISAGLDQTICANDSITLSATGATNYTWNNGVTNGIAFSPSSTQTYTVSGVDQNNCSNTDQVHVTVLALPIVNAGIDQTTCLGTAVVLNATGANSLSWNNGITNGLYFTPTFTQSYVVTGIDANNCVNTDEVLITVNSLPIISAGDDQTICPGVFITLNAGGGLNYQWNNGVTNGVPFIPTATQNYIATGSDINGCYNSDTVLVTVIDCTGIEEQNDVSVSVYPNPLQDVLNFDFYQVISGGIELVSLEGKLISSIQFKDLESYQMDLSSLAFGPYFIRINLNGQIKSIKVIKAN